MVLSRPRSVYRCTKGIGCPRDQMIRQTMKRTPLPLLVAAATVFALSSCVPTPTPQPTTTKTGDKVIETQTATPTATTPPPEKKVVVEGREYTCAQLLGLNTLECDRINKTAFDKWGEKVDDYVNSGKLGPLGNGKNAPVSYGDVAQLGLLACSVSEVGNTSSEYIPAARTIVKDAAGTELLPFWFEAQKSMCPEFEFKG